jgi:hypothetical protein
MASSPQIIFPDWVPSLAPPPPPPERKPGRVEVIGGLSRWLVSADWMQQNGNQPYHEMVLALDKAGEVLA